MLGIRWLEIAAIDCSSELVSIKIVSVSAASIRVSTDSLIFVSRILGREWCGKHEYRNHQHCDRLSRKLTRQGSTLNKMVGLRSSMMPHLHM